MEKSSKNQDQDFQNWINWPKKAYLKILAGQSLLNDPYSISWKFQGDSSKTCRRRFLDSITHKCWNLTGYNFGQEQYFLSEQKLLIVITHYQKRLKSRFWDNSHKEPPTPLRRGCYQYCDNQKIGIIKDTQLKTYKCFEAMIISSQVITTSNPRPRG